LAISLSSFGLNSCLSRKVFDRPLLSEVAATCLRLTGHNFAFDLHDRYFAHGFLYRVADRGAPTNRQPFLEGHVAAFTGPGDGHMRFLA
jgi:hypothetical protein